MKAHVICNNDAIYHVVIGTIEEAENKLLKLKTECYERNAIDGSYWHIHTVDCNLPGQNKAVSDIGNKLWSMSLHEEIKLAGNIWIVIRVPGGWIYSINEEKGPIIFVPLNNEFVGTGE